MITATSVKKIKNKQKDLLSTNKSQQLICCQQTFFFFWFVLTVTKPCLELQLPTSHEGSIIHHRHILTLCRITAKNTMTCTVTWPVATTAPRAKPSAICKAKHKRVTTLVAANIQTVLTSKAKILFVSFFFVPASKPSRNKVARICLRNTHLEHDQQMHHSN